MAEIQTIIGSLPVCRGEYDAGVSYFRDNQVTMYGSTFQSIADDNVGYPPAEERDDGKVYAINTDKWIIVANALAAYNAGKRINDLAENTEIKDEEGNVQDTPFRIIENEEFIMAVVDSEDKVLFGIYRDSGKPYFPLNEMYHVEQNEEFFAVWLDATNHVLFGIRRDGEIIGEIHAVNALKQVISSLRKKVDTINASLQELLDVFSLHENPEYLAVEQDAEGKVLSATNPDGSHYIHNAKSETIPEEFSHIEDPEGRTEITTDAEDKVIGFRDSSGKRHEHDMQITNLEVSNLNLQGNSVNNIQDALKANGFDVKTPIDWSEYITQNGDYPLNLPTPRCARLNIISSSDLTQLSKLGLAGAIEGKNYDIPTVIEFWDMHGNYFKKNSYISGQGNSSMNYPKKNIAIDLFDSEVGGDSFSVRFGDWVSQDSFHLKAYQPDPFKGTCIQAYRVYDSICKTHGLINDYVWKRAKIDFNKIGEVCNGFTDLADTKLLYESGARCFPDGFPCIVYQNGDFWGVYSFQLKKHRDNYMLDKNTPENIHLDGYVNNSSFFKDNVSDINWNVSKSGIEVRNPKDSNLYLMDGTQYDSDTNSGELMDETSEHYEGTKKQKICAKTKKYILDFNNSKAAIYEALATYTESQTDENLQAFKKVFEKYHDIGNLVDYQICSDIIQNWDGYIHNIQWFTYDGIKWFCGIYDCDNTFSVVTNYLPSTKHVILGDHHVFTLLRKYYQKELKEEYKILRNNGIIDADIIIGYFREWLGRIGYDNLMREYKKWSFNNQQTVLNEQWEVVLDENNMPIVGTANYSASQKYSAGDECFYKVEPTTVDIAGGVLKEAYKFRAKTAVDGIPPVSSFNYIDNIYRIYKWIKKNIENMDTLYNYK